ANLRTNNLITLIHLISNNIDNLIAVSSYSVLINKKSNSGGQPRGEIWNAYTIEQKNEN
ncbi:23123_t:CDS:1, partial [Cetraspora pellucida]